MRVLTAKCDKPILPIKCWDGVPQSPWTYGDGGFEKGAMEQLFNLAQHPLAFHHIAAMPDCHQGYGMPIGGVLAALGGVIPNAVGVDIGCGMLAAQVNQSISEGDLKTIIGRIREEIPVGKKHRDVPSPYTVLQKPEHTTMTCPIYAENYDSATLQCGTLGGGNHFIEIQVDENGRNWVMIHSGSRNLGKKIADSYNRLAVTLNDCWKSSVPKSHQLAFLPRESKVYGDYINEMGLALAFAKENRKVMFLTIKDILLELAYEFVQYSALDVHHNYAAQEHHFGSNVWVHRKGATRARLGERGIIPGSQGSSSYIVVGKGCADSFESCSHGAGRRMGREEAKRELSLADEQASMEGILHSVRGVADLDEAPGAYKNIEEVMANQEDLVTVLHTLRPLAVVKG